MKYSGKILEKDLDSAPVLNSNGALDQSISDLDYVR